MWNAIFEIGSVIVTPEENEAYHVKVKIGEHEYTTDEQGVKPVVGANYNRFNHRSKEPVQLKMPYGGIENISDVFIYLYKKKGGAASFLGNATGGSTITLMSYARFKASEFTELNAKLQWIELKPEPVSNEVKSPEMAGILSFKCSIYNQIDTTVNVMKEPNWSKKLPRRPKLCNIRCFIYSCRDLPAADEDGTSDPILQIWDTADKKEQIKKTECIDDTCDPMYY